MAFDGIVLKSIIKELDVLKYGKVNKIYEPSKNELIFSIYANKTNYALNIDISANNYRIGLTTNQKVNPYIAPNFCMLLRKHLNGSIIRRIYMNDLERIAFIEFECFNELNDKVCKTLVVELMGKYSNAILVNQNNVIIDALKRYNNSIESSSRTIIPSRKYAFPHSVKKDLLSISEKDFVDYCMKQGIHTLDSLLSNCFTGISKLFIQNSLEELKISNTVSENSLRDVYKYIIEIVNSNFAICKQYKNNYTISLSTEKENLQVNFFLDDFYFSKSQDEMFKTYRNNLLKIINSVLDKLIRKLDNINNKITSCKDIEKFKIWGELLIANIYRIDTLKISENSIVLENYYDNNNPIEISINNSISTSQNAENYFKKYNKLKNTLEIVNIQKKEAQLELNYIESLIYSLDNADDIESVNDIYNEISENILFNDSFKTSKKGTKKESSSLDNYLRLKIDGYTVLVGKNNKQNDYITMKLANQNDYWFHTQDIHGSHVVLRCNGNMPKIETIIKCASIAAYYSKAKFSSNVPVDYVLKKYVKKPNGAAPGFVIYTNQKTVNVEPNSGTTTFNQ